MRYPNFLKPNATIGLVAPSFGISGEPYTTKFTNGKKKFVELGYTFKEASSIYTLQKARSASAKQRADEFMRMYLDDSVDFIFSVAGGELMCEILPYLDFKLLAQSTPKFFMGYSDNTNLTFLLTLLCDTASIYGLHLTEYGMEKWDLSLIESYEIITGKRFSQNSYDFYQIDDKTHEVGNYLTSYNKTEPIIYKTLNDQDVTISGRLIGGCLDVLMFFCGTHYDKVADFKKRYQQDGVIFYLEACDLNPIMMTRSLLQLKTIGWFDNCNGIVFGRSYRDQEVVFDISFSDAIRDTLSDLNIPIIIDMDFGHLPPCFTIINGSYATISIKEKKGNITYQLK